MLLADRRTSSDPVFFRRLLLHLWEEKLMCLLHIILLSQISNNDNLNF